MVFSTINLFRLPHTQIYASPDKESAYIIIDSHHLYNLFFSKKRSDERISFLDLTHLKLRHAQCFLDALDRCILI